MACFSPDELLDKRREEVVAETEEASDVFDLEWEIFSIEREARRRSRAPVSGSAVISNLK